MHVIVMMYQNIIGLVLKTITSGYPAQVALSGCHGTGNQVNFKISISKNS